MEQSIHHISVTMLLKHSKENTFFSEKFLGKLLALLYALYVC